ncbi:hypothetical protein BDR05DRAFT_947874 [Suillus weaverae]|nr:hypothetical protein BDR05DRAFT_947874 [Suillus weaverae]
MTLLPTAPGCGKQSVFPRQIRTTGQDEAAQLTGPDTALIYACDGVQPATASVDVGRACRGLEVVRHAESEALFPGSTQVSWVVLTEDLLPPISLVSPTPDTPQDSCLSAAPTYAVTSVVCPGPHVSSSWYITYTTVPFAESPIILYSSIPPYSFFIHTYLARQYTVWMISCHHCLSSTPRRSFRRVIGRQNRGRNVTWLFPRIDRSKMSSLGRETHLLVCLTANLLVVTVAVIVVAVSTSRPLVQCNRRFPTRIILMAHPLARDVNRNHNNAIDRTFLALANHRAPSLALGPVRSRPSHRERANPYPMPNKTYLAEEKVLPGHAKLTVKQLQHLCCEENLSTRGRKTDLTARLAAHPGTPNPALVSSTPSIISTVPTSAEPGSPTQSSASVSTRVRDEIDTLAAHNAGQLVRSFQDTLGSGDSSHIEDDINDTGANAPDGQHDEEPRRRYLPTSIDVVILSFYQLCCSVTEAVREFKSIWNNCNTRGGGRISVRSHIVYSEFCHAIEINITPTPHYKDPLAVRPGNPRPARLVREIPEEKTFGACPGQVLSRSPQQNTSLCGAWGCGGELLLSPWPGTRRLFDVSVDIDFLPETDPYVVSGLQIGSHTGSLHPHSGPRHDSEHHRVMNDLRGSIGEDRLDVTESASLPTTLSLMEEYYQRWRHVEADLWTFTMKPCQSQERDGQVMDAAAAVYRRVCEESADAGTADRSPVPRTEIGAPHIATESEIVNVADAGLWCEPNEPETVACAALAGMESAGRAAKRERAESDTLSPGQHVEANTSLDIVKPYPSPTQNGQVMDTLVANATIRQGLTDAETANSSVITDADLRAPQTKMGQEIRNGANIGAGREPSMVEALASTTDNEKESSARPAKRQRSGL